MDANCKDELNRTTLQYANESDSSAITNLLINTGVTNEYGDECGAEDNQKAQKPDYTSDYDNILGDYGDSIGGEEITCVIF